MEIIYILNFLFCLIHVHFLTRGGLGKFGTVLNWVALGFNSLAVLLQLVQ